MKKLLKEVFMLENQLKPEQEKLVDKHYGKIMALHKDGQEPSEDDVKSCLRDLLRDSEKAEGEDESEIEA